MKPGFHYFTEQIIHTERILTEIKNVVFSNIKLYLNQTVPECDPKLSLNVFLKYIGQSKRNGLRGNHFLFSKNNDFDPTWLLCNPSYVFLCVCNI